MLRILCVGVRIRVRLPTKGGVSGKSAFFTLTVASYLTLNKNTLISHKQTLYSFISSRLMFYIKFI